MRTRFTPSPRTALGLARVPALVLALAGLTDAQDNPGTATAGPQAERAFEPRIEWDFEQGDFRFDEVVLGEGMAFALDRAGKIHALDAAEGDLLWSSEGKEKFSYSFGLGVANRPELDAVVVGCDSGLFALDRRTGNELWRTELPLGVAGPACAGEAIVAGSADGHVYGFDYATGEVLWKHGYMDDRPDDPPGFDGENARFQGRPARPRGAATDGKMVVLSIFDQCRMLALDASTGQRLWDFRTQGWTSATPAIAHRHVFVGSQDKHFYAVDKQTGELAWKVKTGSRVSGAGRSTGDTVYFGSCDARLYAIDVATGDVRWKFETDHEEGRGAPIYSRPLVMGGTVYLAAMRGKVYAVDCASGKLRWDFRPMPDSEINSDLVTDGELLILTTRKVRDKGESTVVAFTRS